MTAHIARLDNDAPIRIARASETTRVWPFYALALSFVLTGFRLDIGFIILDPSLVVIPVCLGLWTGELARGRRMKPFDAVGILALLIVMAAWFSFFGAIDVMTWLKRAMKVTWLFGLYMFLVNQASDKSTLAAFLRASFWGCAAAGVAVIFQTVGRWISLGYGEVFGAAGIFANSNEAATYLTIFIVMGLALYASGKYEAVMSRRLLLALIGVIALGVLFSRSRSGVIGVTVVSTILFIRTKGVRGLVVGAIAVLVILSLTPATAVIVNRLLASVGMSGNEDFDEFMQGGSVYRLYLAELYWTVIKANPVFGIGAGNYGFIGQLNLDLPPPPPEAALIGGPDTSFNFSSHDGFLNWWAETGTIGFLALVASIALAMRAAWRVRRSRTQDPWWRGIATGTVGGLGIFVLTNLVAEFGVSESRLWILLALASVTSRQSNPQAG